MRAPGPCQAACWVGEPTLVVKISRDESDLWLLLPPNEYILVAVFV